MRNLGVRAVVTIAVSAAAVGGVVALSAPAAQAATCVTSAQMGHCGGYAPLVAGEPDSYVDQNVWSPIGGWRQTLSANSPGDWQVVANMPAGNTSVVSFPNTGQAMNEAPLAGYAELTSSFTQTMNKTASTSGWSMYDVWVDNWSYEIMIQLDFANNGDCDSVAGATFNGQAWHLCDFGSTLAWKLGPDEAHKGSERTGTVDLKAMLTWLESHGYLPGRTTMTNVSFGWEICSTGGQNETFQVSQYNLHASTTTGNPTPTTSSPKPSPTTSSPQPSPTSTSPHPTGRSLVGRNTTQPTVDSNPQGTAQAYQYVAARTGTAASINVYVDAANTATAGRLGIYSNDTGDPGTLLSQVSFKPKAGWNTVAVSGLTITAGRRYWLAELGTTGTLAYRDQSGSAPYSETKAVGSALPAHWSGGTRWNSGGASLYVGG